MRKRKVRKLYLTLLALAHFFISISPFASEGMLKEIFLEGQYTNIKKSSKGECPDITINYQNLDKKTKLLMLNPRIVFNLSNLGKTSFERVSKGCRYEESLTFKDHILTQDSKRSQCPNVNENGRTTFSLKSKGSKLKLTLTQNKQSTYQCMYKKGGK